MQSGFVANDVEWQAITGHCRRAKAWLVYDAAMERILFDGRKVIHPASLPEMRERTRLLLEKGKVAATPMNGWGPLAHAYLRFVFANEPVARLADIRERVRAA